MKKAVRMMRLSTKRGQSLQVSTHDNFQVGELWNLGLQELGVFNSLVGTVDRTGTNNDQKAVIVACDDPCSIVATCCDGLLGGSGELSLMPQECRLDQRVVLQGDHWRVRRESSKENVHQEHECPGSQQQSACCFLGRLGEKLGEGRMQEERED